MIIPAPVLRSRSFFDRLRVFSPASKKKFSKKGRLLPNLNKFLFPPHNSSLDKIHLFTSTQYLLCTEYLYRYTVQCTPVSKSTTKCITAQLLFSFSSRSEPEQDFHTESGQNDPAPAPPLQHRLYIIVQLEENFTWNSWFYGTCHIQHFTTYGTIFDFSECRFKANPTGSHGSKKFLL